MHAALIPITIPQISEDAYKYLEDLSKDVRRILVLILRSSRDSSDVITFMTKQTTAACTQEEKGCRDVEINSSGILYVFSDGIGKISPEFAKLVAKECGLIEFTPSAFQIHYGGYKGVVAVDSNLSKKLCLRKSMRKFESDYTTVDVLAWSKYHPCYLNRQLITLLSTLGVEDVVFEEKLRDALEQFDSFYTDPMKALAFMAPGEHKIVLGYLISCGYNPKSEPFLSIG